MLRQIDVTLAILLRDEVSKEQTWTQQTLRIEIEREPMPLSEWMDKVECRAMDVWFMRTSPLPKNFHMLCVKDVADRTKL